jgi:hypothetical protein
VAEDGKDPELLNDISRRRAITLTVLERSDAFVVPYA